MLHGLFRLNPWTSRAAPTRSSSQRDFNAKPVRLFDRMLKQRLPLRTHELDWSARQPDIDLQKNRAPDARAAHRLQIGGQSFPRHHAVHEIPINPGAG